MSNTYMKEEKHIELFEISATLNEISTLLSMVTDELEDELRCVRAVQPGKRINEVYCCIINKYMRNGFTGYKDGDIIYIERTQIHGGRFYHGKCI